MNTLSHLDLSTPYFLMEVFGFGVVAGLFSCAILEVPLLAGLIGPDSTPRALKKIGAFVAGLTISYIIIGVAFDTVSRWLSQFQGVSRVIYIGVGLAAITWGLWMLFKPDAADHHHISLDPVSTRGLVGFFGLGLALAWIETPTCPGCGPIMLLISMSTFAIGKAGLGIASFATYSLGQSVPVIVLAAGIISSQHVSRLKSFRPWLLAVIGNLLIFTGMVYLWLA